MSAFELQVRSKADGQFVAAWFDDSTHLWNDERLQRPASLRNNWVAPRLRLHKPKQGVTAVLFNPNALAVAEGVRDELAAFPELEFLPVDIEGHGTFFIMHVLAAVELPLGTEVRRAPPPSGNIVGLHGFPLGYEPPNAFFRVLQPPGSAARATGAVTRATYSNVVGRDAVGRAAGRFFEAIPR